MELILQLARILLPVVAVLVVLVILIAIMDRPRRAKPGAGTHRSSRRRHRRP